MATANTNEERLGKLFSWNLCVTLMQYECNINIIYNIQSDVEIRFFSLFFLLCAKRSHDDRNKLPLVESNFSTETLARLVHIRFIHF